MIGKLQMNKTYIFRFWFLDEKKTFIQSNLIQCFKLREFFLGEY